MSQLILKGVRQNNLKNLNLEIPLGKAVVVTGPSGSGKSSLAFETIYAEGQRRYMQSLSTYARQFLEKFTPPLLESIENIPPTIAIEQYNPVRNSRATVGTLTEIYDHLRLLFGKIGHATCEDCGTEMARHTIHELTAQVMKTYRGETILLAFSKELPKEPAIQKNLMEEYLRSGFSRVLIDGTVENIEQLIQKKISDREISVVTDRIKIPGTPEKATETRLVESTLLTLRLGRDQALLTTYSGGKLGKFEVLTLLPKCPKCGKLGQDRLPNHFSFNNPLGACETCKGFGNTLEIDEDKVIPNRRLSLRRGAIEPFTKPSLRNWYRKTLEFCEKERIDVDLPFGELPKETQRLIIDGTKKFRGIRGVFSKMEEKRYKLRIRVFISRYTSPFTCKTCQGARLKTSSLGVRIQGKNISEVSNLSIAECSNFLSSLKLNQTERKISKDLLGHLTRRLGYLNTVGVGYLTLSRQGRTLSGGEYQRILLATQLSQGLMDTLYVLDEPSIGLHPKDTEKLLEVLENLKEQGNSLVIVEHDPEVIEWGDYIIDMGPGSGRLGGEISFCGSQDYFKLSNGVTAEAVRKWRGSCRDETLKNREREHSKLLEIRGARGNNLKNIDVSFPLECLIAVTGVSGSGKSTLVVDTLYPALAKIYRSASEKISRFDSLSGFEYLTGVELIDQEPIGKSSRSNPVTFVKAYDEIRSLFAGTREAIGNHLTPGHFSFNVSGGRCETCEGEGRIRVDMVFLDDIYVPCQTCDEKRFKPHVLKVRYRGKNIDEVLHMTVDDAYTFFEGSSGLRSKLSLLRDVGLGYLQLGQPSFTLSGGEAQRIKIARELTGAGMHSSRTLFILDEPTTGLHFNEVAKLISILKRLVRAGNSVIVIEHNLQMICAAEHVIDLGPGGGIDGGKLQFSGSPRELAELETPYTGAYLAKLIGKNS